MRRRFCCRIIQLHMTTATQLERGMMLRDLTAPTLDGERVQLSDLRGRRNLVLIFAGTNGEEQRLLSELRESRAELREEEAVAAVIADNDRESRSWYGALAADGTPRAALYITDRYGEIYFAAHPERGLSLPSAAEVLDWLRFINSQCPE
jgi:hypothetical protein